MDSSVYSGQSWWREVQGSLCIFLLVLVLPFCASWLDSLQLYFVILLLVLHGQGCNDIKERVRVIAESPQKLVCVGSHPSTSVHDCAVGTLAPLFALLCKNPTWMMRFVPDLTLSGKIRGCLASAICSTNNRVKNYPSPFGNIDAL